MTKAPSAPRTRSFHMNANRSCPGVPNRYSLSSSSSVMQPKSSATVVVVFPGTCPVRSISAATDVIAASVVSGRISDIAPTVVVLPTPNPPAMTIFTGVGGRRVPAPTSRDGFEATNNPFDQVDVVGLLRAGTGDDEIPLLCEIRHQDARDADVQPEEGGDLRHGFGLAAECDDVAALEGELRGGRGGVVRYDLCLDLQRLVHRMRAARGQQVRAHQRDVRVFASALRTVVGTTHDLSLLRPAGYRPTASLSSSISAGVSTPLARLANTAISYAIVPRLACLVANTPREQPMLMVQT